MTYEYHCLKCKHHWEKEQKITDKKIDRCPKCKKKSAERLVSGGTGFSLTGSCWARDNYSK